MNNKNFTINCEEWLNFLSILKFLWICRNLYHTTLILILYISFIKYFFSNFWLISKVEMLVIFEFSRSIIDLLLILINKYTLILDIDFRDREFSFFNIRIFILTFWYIWSLFKFKKIWYQIFHFNQGWAPCSTGSPGKCQNFGQK